MLVDMPLASRVALKPMAILCGDLLDLIIAPSDSLPDHFNPKGLFARKLESYDVAEANGAFRGLLHDDRTLNPTSHDSELRLNSTNKLIRRVKRSIIMTRIAV